MKKETIILSLAIALLASMLVVIFLGCLYCYNSGYRHECTTTANPTNQVAVTTNQNRTVPKIMVGASLVIGDNNNGNSVTAGNVYYQNTHDAVGSITNALTLTNSIADNDGGEAEARKFAEDTRKLIAESRALKGLISNISDKDITGTNLPSESKASSNKVSAIRSRKQSNSLFSDIIPNINGTNKTGVFIGEIPANGDITFTKPTDTVIVKEILVSNTNTCYRLDTGDSNVRIPINSIGSNSSFFRFVNDSEVKVTLKFICESTK